MKKGTFHALARFVFQDQPNQQKIEKVEISSSNQTTLKLTPEVLNLIQTEPYQLPSNHPHPPRVNDAVRK